MGKKGKVSADCLSYSDVCPIPSVGVNFGGGRIPEVFPLPIGLGHGRTSGIPPTTKTCFAPAYLFRW